MSLAGPDAKNNSAMLARDNSPVMPPAEFPEDLGQLVLQVRRAAAEAGVGSGDYRLLRSGTNIVLANDSDRLVARVASSDVPVADMSAHLKILSRLVAAGAPFVCPLTGPASLADGRLVTFWPLVDTSTPAEPEALAELVARCHQLPLLPGLRRWAPEFYDHQADSRLARAVRAGAPPALVDQLKSAWRAASRDLAGCWRDRQGKGGEVVLHADPQSANTGRVDSQLRLLDLDGVCAGPAETDLAQIIVYMALGGHSDRIPAVMAAYHLPIDTRLLESAIRARKIKRATWVAALWADRPDVRPVLPHIVATLDDSGARWPVL